MSSESDVAKLRDIIAKLERDNQKLHTKLTANNIAVTPESSKKLAQRASSSEEPIKINRKHLFIENQLIISIQVADSSLKTVSSNDQNQIPDLVDCVPKSAADLDLGR